MQFGHASWIPVVIFGGMFLMRYLTSQKRRGGSPRGPGGPRGFTGTDPRGVPGRPPPAPSAPSGPASPSAPSGGGTSTGVPPGWLRDPFVRHEERYWSGTEWTEHVLDDGVPATDSPPTTSTSNDGH